MTDFTAIKKIAKIDSHHHLWDVTQNSYPWLTSYPKATHPRVMYDTSKIGEVQDGI